MPRKAVPTQPKPCAHCGALMLRKRFNGRLEDLSVFSRRKFCSLSCANSGEKGGRSDSTFSRRAGRGRKKACELCGDTHWRLHVHHRSGDRSDNSPANLQTLCPSCHKLSHTRLGAGPLTETRSTWKRTNAITAWDDCAVTAMPSSRKSPPRSSKNSSAHAPKSQSEVVA